MDNEFMTREFDDVATHPRLTVIGTGYLGATHAICMATL